MLEEQFDPNYEPTPDEIREYAGFLGMDPEEDADFFYIAREGLKTPLPPGWKPCKTPQGDLYYFNFNTGESLWDHPCDEIFRRKFQEAKKAALEKKKKNESSEKDKEKPKGAPIPSMGTDSLNIGLGLGGKKRKAKSKLSLAAPLKTGGSSLAPMTLEPLDGDRRAVSADAAKNREPVVRQQANDNNDDDSDDYNDHKTRQLQNIEIDKKEIQRLIENAISDTLQEALKTSVGLSETELRTELSAQLAIARKELEESHQQELKQLKARLATEMKAAEDERNEEEREAKRQHMERIKALEGGEGLGTLQTELSEQLKKEELRLRAEYDAKLEELRKEHEAKLKNVREELERHEDEERKRLEQEAEERTKREAEALMLQGNTGLRLLRETIERNTKETTDTAQELVKTLNTRQEELRTTIRGALDKNCEDMKQLGAKTSEIDVNKLTANILESVESQLRTKLSGFTQTLTTVLEKGVDEAEGAVAALSSRLTMQVPTSIATVARQIESRALATDPLSSEPGDRDRDTDRDGDRESSQPPISRPKARNASQRKSSSEDEESPASQGLGSPMCTSTPLIPHPAKGQIQGQGLPKESPRNPVAVLLADERKKIDTALLLLDNESHAIALRVDSLKASRERHVVRWKRAKAVYTQVKAAAALGLGLGETDAAYREARAELERLRADKQRLDTEAGAINADIRKARERRRWVKKRREQVDAALARLRKAERAVGDASDVTFADITRLSEDSTLDSGSSTPTRPALGDLGTLFPNNARQGSTPTPPTPPPPRRNSPTENSPSPAASARARRYKPDLTQQFEGVLEAQGRQIELLQRQLALAYNSYPPAQVFPVPMPIQEPQMMQPNNNNMFDPRSRLMQSNMTRRTENDMFQPPTTLPRESAIDSVRREAGRATKGRMAASDLASARLLGDAVNSHVDWLQQLRNELDNGK